MTTLIEIGEEWSRFTAALDDLPGGEIPPDLQAELDAWFAAITEADGEKLEAYCRVIRNLESNAAVAKAEAEQYAAFAKSQEGRVASLKSMMKLHLEATGRKKVFTSTGRSITVCANGGKLPLIVDPGTDPKELPEQFQKVTIAANNDAIRAAIEGGQDVPFAKLGERESHLKIAIGGKGG